MIRTSLKHTDQALIPFNPKLIYCDRYPFIKGPVFFVMRVQYNSSDLSELTELNLGYHCYFTGFLPVTMKYEGSSQ